MQEISFEDAVELIQLSDPRYSRDAYTFVREALDYTQKSIGKDTGGSIRHVSGQELLGGIRDYALAHYGPMATMVLEEWGIRACRDFGEIVFNMVETCGCAALTSSDGDSPGDIQDVKSLASKLEKQRDPVSRFLWSVFSDAARLHLSSNPTGAATERILVNELNRIVGSRAIYAPERFVGLQLSERVKALTAHRLQGIQLALLNRMLLEDVYQSEIAKSHGLLAKTEKDSRSDFENGYDFYDAFQRPFLPERKRPKPEPASACGR